MVEAKFRWSVYEHPTEGFHALRAQHLDITALLLGPAWTFLRRLWLLGAGLTLLEIGAVVALVFWGKLFLLPLLAIHAYVGFGSGRLQGKALKENGWTYLGDVDAPSDITASARVKSGQLEAQLEPLALDFIPCSFKPVYAVVQLTWQATMRYRVFWVVVGMLVLNVLLLPLVLKGDGSAKGMVNILLTYTLAMVFLLLGATTVWLACGTLAGDVAGCQMQLIASKPIPRWQIWLGKWMGIMSFNAALLFLAGASIYGMVYYRVDNFADRRLAELRMKPGDEVEKMSQVSYNFRGYPRWLVRPWTQKRVRAWTVKLEKDLGLGREGRAKELAEMPVYDLYAAFKKAYEDFKRDHSSRMGPDWLVDELRKLLADKEMEQVKSQFLAGRASVKPNLTGAQKSLEDYSARIFLEDVKRRMPGNYFAEKQNLEYADVDEFRGQVTDALRHHLGQLQKGDAEWDPTKSGFPPDGNLWWKDIYDLAKVHMEAVGGDDKAEWVFHLSGASELPEDEPITLRFKLEGFVDVADKARREAAQIAIQDHLYPATVQFGDTIIDEMLTIRTFHDYFVYPSDFKNDQLKVIFHNRGRYALSIPFWKGGLELLYQESSFGINFLRSMAVVFCWLGILGAMGLAMASFMEFPMAAFTCIGLLVISLCTGLMQEVVDDGGLRQTYTLGKRNENIMDTFSIVAFKVLTSIISPLKDYSPITSLSEGRSITWGMLGKAYLVVWGLGGGVFMVFGMGVFSQRELALYGKE